MSRDRFSSRTAIAIVIANMIGTGVFTSLGFQLEDIRSGFVLLALWGVGGIAAFCGALAYAELGACLPRSGGEYNFLTEIYHPAAGFVSGWISATVGFAAPTALAAITFGSYLSSAIPVLGATPLAVGLVAVLTLLHATTHRNSAGVQNAFTIIKIGLIVAFCAAAIALVPAPQDIGFLPAPGDGALLTSSAFAVSLIYVSYAYTGWNAATYLSDELDAPQRNLPRVLGFGVAIVAVLYLLLNFVFLYVAPASAMVGRVEIGYVAATYAFGPAGGRIMGIVLALLLVSTVSAMIIAGPRVLQVIGQDVPALRLLSRTNRDDVPHVAVWLQGLIAITFIVTASFQKILILSGFLLALNTFAAVLGLFVLRWTRPTLERPFRAWGYPLTPLLYLALTGWTMWYVVADDPQATGAGMLVIAAGAVFYVVASRLRRR